MSIFIVKGTFRISKYLKVDSNENDVGREASNHWASVWDVAIEGYLHFECVVFL
jgi:hypothetical protein